MSKPGAERSLADWESAGSYPGVTIIVLNYRAPAMTVECLQSVAGLRYPGVIEVLVIENGSGDDSEAVLRDALPRLALNCRLIVRSENAGFAGGVSAVWSEARQPLICLFNNDALMHPDCLRLLVDALRGRRDLGAVWPFDAPREARDFTGPASDLPGAGEANGTYSLLGYNIWKPLLDARRCFTPSGVCLLLPSDLVADPFPPEYFAYYEDVHLGWRLRLRGLAAERIPEAVIFHEGTATSRRKHGFRWTLAFHAEKNRLANLLIFFEVGTLLRLLPLLGIDELKKLAAALLRPRDHDAWWGYLKIYLRSRWWLLTHARWLRQERRRRQGERVVPDRDLLPLLSGRFLDRDHGLAGFLNRLALKYCRLAGLRTVEWAQARSRELAGP